MKIKSFAILIATLFHSPMICAAPVGNTSAPKIIQEGLFISCESLIDFRVGYEGDFVTDGRMRQCDEGNGRVDSYKQWTNSGTVTLNVLDRIDIYGVLGVSRTKADWRFEDTSHSTVSRIELETQYNFLWGAGARAILYEWCNTSLGLGGRYTSCHYDPTRLTSDGLIVDVSRAYFNWEEWQVNLDVSYKIDLFTPYIGLKYSNARAQLKGFVSPISANLTGSNKFQNRTPVGLYVGCTLSTGKFFMLNIEGRVIDEEAVTISCDFRI